MKVRILGSGTSSGVPRIGNDWGACDRAEPRNRRTRSSVLVEHEALRILVDTSPDLREQLLAAGIADLDAVIWTHDHADHCHGIDDLRQVYHARGAAVRGFARENTLATLRSRFGYVFEGRGEYPPTVIAENLPDALTVGEVTIRVVDQPHGRITAAGLRFEARGRAIGYATDFNIMTPAMRDLYRDLDIWIVDALRELPHPTHPSVADVLRWIDELQPRRTLLVHMDHSMDYRQMLSQLPSTVEPAFDGLELTL